MARPQQRKLLGTANPLLSRELPGPAAAHEQIRSRHRLPFCVPNVALNRISFLFRLFGSWLGFRFRLRWLGFFGGSIPSLFLARGGRSSAGFFLSGLLVVVASVISDIKAASLEDESGAGADLLFYFSFAPSFLGTKFFWAG